MSVAAMNRIIRSITSDGSFHSIFKAVQAISVTEKTLQCRFQVTKAETNVIGTLHGGYISSLIDVVSSLDLVRHGHLVHVTTELNTSYLSAAKINSWVLVESEVLKIGKSLAFCDVKVVDEATGDLIAKGRHTKYLLP